MIKFEKTMYVVIKSCDSPTSWYANKVGTIHKVTDELFPPDYTTICAKNKDGLYLMIHHDDAEVITPSMVKKFLLWLGKEQKQDDN